MSPYTSYILETFVVLLVVCGLAVAVIYGAKRLGIGRSSGPIKLRGQLPIDARRSIYLVTVGARVYVVGVADGGFTKLGEMDEADLPPDAPPPKPVFGEVLKRVLGQSKKGGGT